ncbi:MAG: PilW family protein [Pseudohongiellaceae bacterium]
MRYLYLHKHRLPPFRGTLPITPSLRGSRRCFASPVGGATLTRYQHEHPHRRQTERGFTLLELVVSLALGLTLITGVAMVFVENNRSAVQDEEVARLLENGRWIVRHLGRELAMAGFWGKSLDIAAVGQHGSVNIGRDCGRATEGWVMQVRPLQFLNDVDRNGVASSFACLPARHVVSGSDVIAIKRMADSETADANISSGQIYLRNPNREGTAGLFFRGGGTGTPPNLGGSETNWAYLPQVYYLRSYAVSVGDDIPMLCRAHLTQDSSPDMRNECLVEGIENLQLEFGIDSDADFTANYYSSAPNEAELSAAVSVRLYVLVRSVSEISGYTNDKTYTLGALTIPAANDAYYRRVFSTTVLLRNPARLIGVGNISTDS